MRWKTANNKRRSRVLKARHRVHLFKKAIRHAAAYGIGARKLREKAQQLDHLIRAQLRAEMALTSFRNIYKKLVKATRVKKYGRRQQMTRFEDRVIGLLPATGEVLQRRLRAKYGYSPSVAGTLSITLTRMGAEGRVQQTGAGVWQLKGTNDGSN